MSPLLTSTANDAIPKALTASRMTGWASTGGSPCLRLPLPPTESKSAASTPPRPLARRLTQLRRASRALSRTAPGSRNRVKAARRLSREHARIVNQRRSFLHATSTQLTKTHGKLVIEDLNVAGLMRNVRLGRAIGDAAWA